MDVRGYFLIMAGVVWIAAVAMFLLAPANITNYTVMDVAFYKTPYRTIGQTSYNFNDPKDIRRIPYRIDGWKGVDFRYPKRVYEILDANIILSRAYSKNGTVIWLDIINSDRRKSFHDPRVCYGAKWDIVRERVIPIEFGNLSKVVFERIYVNRLDLVNKKDRWMKMVVLYWFMFRGGEGMTMFRMSALAKDFNRTCDVMKDFAKDLLQIVYKKVERPKTIAETWMERYGVLTIVLAFIPGTVLIAYGVRLARMHET